MAYPSPKDFFKTRLGGGGNCSEAWLVDTDWVAESAVAVPHVHAVTVDPVFGKGNIDGGV